MLETHPADAASEIDNETAAERQARIVREAAMIAEAEAEIDAGLGIELEDLEAWLKALDTDEGAPLPTPRSNVS